MYRWDYDADAGYDTAWRASPYATNTYAIGIYSVILQVTNASGESASCTNLNLIEAGPAIAYASPSSVSPTYPYTNWLTAATNLQDAIDAAVDGSTVLVGNGTFWISQQISIGDGMTVRSSSGPLQTTIRRQSGNTRIVCMAGATNMVLDGFTLSGGSGVTVGAGVLVDGSMGQTEASILNCIVTNNTGSSVGGISCGYGATTLIRNCLVAGNYGGWVSSLAGHQSGQTTIESCTITGNEAPGTQPAVYSEHSANTIGRNTIVHNNSGGNDILNGNWTYTCSDPAMTGAGNTNADPLFVSAGVGYGLSHSGGDYRLQPNSPCVNKGSDQSWMNTAVDLAGNSRVALGTVDMGAYEYTPPQGSLIVVR